MTAAILVLFASFLWRKQIFCCLTGGHRFIRISRHKTIEWNADGTVTETPAGTEEHLGYCDCCGTANHQLISHQA